MSKNPDTDEIPCSLSRKKRQFTRIYPRLDHDIPLFLYDLKAVLGNFFHQQTITIDSESSDEEANNQGVPTFTAYSTEVSHLTKRLTYLPYTLGFAKRAQELYGRFPLVKGGSTHQDRTSGQGKDIQASHIIRAAVDIRFKECNSELYYIFARLTSVTENQWKDINMSSTIGGEIDRLSEKYIIYVRDKPNATLSADIGCALKDDYEELAFGEKRSYLRALRNVSDEVIETAYHAGYNLI